MPQIDTPRIDSIKNKKVAKRLQFMLAERAVLGYTFSWEKLLESTLELCSDAAHTEEVPDESTLAAKLKECVCAFKEDDAKQIKEALNEEIAIILADYELPSLRHADPFGRDVDFLLMHSHSTSFKKDDAMALLVRRFKLDAADVAATFEECTTKKPFTTVQARAAKPSEGPESKKRR